MAFRDDRDALRARAEAAERERDAARAELEDRTSSAASDAAELARLRKAVERDRAQKKKTRWWRVNRRTVLSVLAALAVLAAGVYVSTSLMCVRDGAIEGPAEVGSGDKPTRPDGDGVQASTQPPRTDESRHILFAATVLTVRAAPNDEASAPGAVAGGAASALVQAPDDDASGPGDAPSDASRPPLEDGDGCVLDLTLTEGASQVQVLCGEHVVYQGRPRIERTSWCAKMTGMARDALRLVDEASPTRIDLDSRAGRFRLWTDEWSATLATTAYGGWRKCRGDEDERVAEDPLSPRVLGLRDAEGRDCVVSAEPGPGGCELGLRCGATITRVNESTCDVDWLHGGMRDAREVLGALEGYSPRELPCDFDGRWAGMVLSGASSPERTVAWMDGALELDGADAAQSKVSLDCRAGTMTLAATVDGHSMRWEGPLQGTTAILRGRETLVLFRD